MSAVSEKPSAAVEPWHTRSADDAMARLSTVADGLTAAEAAARLLKSGPNALPAAPHTTALRVLVAQLRGIIVYLLVAAIAVSLLFGDWIEAAAVAAVLVINTLIGFVTEYRARGAMDALLNLQVPRASVLRDGRLVVINAREIVPGDVIEVDTGRQVPADARLIRAADMHVDEAPLTGESLPVHKVHDAVMPENTPLADRTNMVYTGTSVTSGLARAVVVATGAATELGRIGALTSSITQEQTPLEHKLDALGQRLVWLTLVVAAVVGALGFFNGLPLHTVIETAIALAIAAVPEALPAVATIALAVGMHRMAQRHALVRRLPAVESLGSTTVICTDKTRTLTSGEMAVVRVETTDADAVRVFEAGALASRVQAEAVGADEPVRVDPVDRAILAAAETAGVDRAALLTKWPQTGLLPFSSDRKLMATFHQVEGQLVAFAKGAPVAIAAICRPETRDKILEINQRLAGEGLRVIAVATGHVSAPTADALSGLTSLGLIGMADPPAPGVKETIAVLRAAGLRTVMLTGDQRLTAESVGRELKVIDGGDTAIDGQALDHMSPEAVSDAVQRHAVFSRITPEHKLIIVRALQASGEIVAMLGDGVNDAAALKQANVGVAMGKRGTDVAKQAAAVVLQDDRFETIAIAVEQGRVIFDNIRKFVFYLFSCNIAEILLLLIAGVAGLPLPLLPLQLLWLNMLTDTFPALALALEPGDAGIMQRPPRRPDDAFLSRAFIGGILLYGGLITLATMGAYLWAIDSRPERATTIAFMTLAFAQVLHLGNARRHGPVLSPKHLLSNPYAIAGAAIAAGLQLAAYFIAPLAAVLHVTALDRQEWLVTIGCALVPAVIGQTIKLVRSWRHKSHLTV